MFKTSSQKWCHIWNNVEKHGTAQKGLDEKTICSLRFTCRINKTMNIHSEYVILLFYRNYVYTKASQCNIICTLPVLLGTAEASLCSECYCTLVLIDMYPVTNHWNTRKLHLCLDTKYMYASGNDFSLLHEQKPVQSPLLAYIMKTFRGTRKKLNDGGKRHIRQQCKKKM
jgi:hypothetical protein